MPDYTTLRNYAPKLLTIAAVSLLILTVFSLFVNQNQGESHALLSVDTNNDDKIVKRGESVLHNITVKNDNAGRNLIINLSYQIVSVSMGGNASNWSVRFWYVDHYITNITLDSNEEATVGVEVTAPHNAVLHETATIRVAGKDGYPPVSGPLNTTRTYQNGEYGTYLTLHTIVGQSYDVPHLGVPSDWNDRKDVNPLTPTMYKIRVTNFGKHTDSFRLTYNIGTPVRGESRATGVWRVRFSPSAYIQDLGSLDYTYVYVNVTAPADAQFGEYPITITASSRNSNYDGTTSLTAIIPRPDLYASAEDVDFSRFPVISGQEMTINLTVHNNGGALSEAFTVNFWLEDTDRQGAYNIIGSARVQAIENHGEAYATVTFTPELSNKITETLTTLKIRIEIDADSEVTEENEDNNVVNTQLEVMKAPKSSPGFDASIYMIFAIVGLAVVLAAGMEWDRRRRK